MTFIPDSTNTFVELLRERAFHKPQQQAYTFLEFRPESGELHLTYEQLDIQARIIATELRSVSQKGDRALLLYRPGLDFICGFFGCLYAGIIAVPVSITGRGRARDRLQRILEDAGATVILSTAAVKRTTESLVGARQGLSWICADELKGTSMSSWEGPTIEPNDLALLQYSSGSTARPKGIMINHANLMHQSSVIQKSSGAKN